MTITRLFNWRPRRPQAKNRAKRRQVWDAVAGPKLRYLVVHTDKGWIGSRREAKNTSEVRTHFTAPCESFNGCITATELMHQLLGGL